MKKPYRKSCKVFAERARFELAIPFWGTHAFQACLFSHSSISPMFSLIADCKYTNNPEI